MPRVRTTPLTQRQRLERACPERQAMDLRRAQLMIEMATLLREEAAGADKASPAPTDPSLRPADRGF